MKNDALEDPSISTQQRHGGRNGRGARVSTASRGLGVLVDNAGGR